MAKNTGDSYRQGSISERSQIKNKKTGQMAKRDTNTGRFIGSKYGTWKGVAKEPDRRK